MSDLEDAEKWALSLTIQSSIRRASRGVPWRVYNRSSAGRVYLWLHRLGNQRQQYKRIDGDDLVKAWKATIAEPVLPGER